MEGPPWLLWPNIHSILLTENDVPQAGLISTPAQTVSPKRMILKGLELVPGGANPHEGRISADFESESLKP